MDLLFAFLGFLIAMVFCLATDITLLWALSLGLVFFFIVAYRRGYSLGKLLWMCRKGIRDGLPIAIFLLLIGCITGLWRASGTVSAFVVYGIELLTPSTFLLFTFLFCLVLSYAIGSAFGVSGTLGVIFMTLAESCGVDPLLTGGAILSGVYFGDRCSPLSANFNLIAGVTNKEIIPNLKKVFLTGLPALLVTTAIYAVLSFLHPMEAMDRSVTGLFTENFSLSPWVFLPAVLMLILPLFKVPLHIAIAVNVVISACVAFFVQHESLRRIFSCLLFGYQAKDPELALLNGGGLLSMAEVVAILFFSCAYSSIFETTGMLRSIEDLCVRATHRIGRFPTLSLMSLAMIAIFSNPTITILLVAELLKKPYNEEDAGEDEFLIDLENSIPLYQGFLPWTVSCYVPILLFGGSKLSLLYAFYLYLTPLFYLFTKKIWYKHL